MQPHMMKERTDAVSEIIMFFLLPSSLPTGLIMNGPSGRDRAGEITPTTKRYDISQHPCHQQHHQQQHCRHTRVAKLAFFLSCTECVYYIVLNVIRRGTNWRMGKVCSNVSQIQCKQSASKANTFTQMNFFVEQTFQRGWTKEVGVL